MKTTNYRVYLSALCVVSILAGFTKVSAGPVRFGQVVQVMNTRPGQSGMGVISKLRVAGDYTFLVGADDDDDVPKTKGPEVQDGRVITETRIDVVRDDVCDCEEEVVAGRGFPKFLLLGLAAIPLAFILIRRKDSPTPTPTIPITQTPTPPMTPTPTPTPPGMTPTPTPPMMTPTPPPEPIPEPMTILLFGTGLASIGLAARRRLGKRKDEGDEKDEEGA